ncbi:hypothetical protein HK097_008305 [Rhizophlyctis rosea]|uniref:Uncharacterized protein n=1 Tax=Rhizophlyctis rosea TaxID=64517 RepID=A0AAD5SI97_9FUNG|nr:hypothetical protein HK097_008305 [Rhizophlyctis rosea]
MAFDLWAALLILNHSTRPVTLRNVTKICGRFTQKDDPESWVHPEDLENSTIPPGSTFAIAGRGHWDHAKGTEGSFELYDRDMLIRKVHWDCPFKLTRKQRWPIKNKVDMEGGSGTWEVKLSGGIFTEEYGPMGVVTIELGAHQIER